MTSSVPRLLGSRRLLGWNVHHRTSVYVLRFDPGSGPGESGRVLAQAMLDAILVVERRAVVDMRRRSQLRFSRLVEKPDGTFDIVWECHAAWISRAAVKAAYRCLLKALPIVLHGARSRRALLEATARLRRICHRRQWSPGAALLAQAARRQQLPHEVLAGSYLRLGEGSVHQVVSDDELGVERHSPRSADRVLRRLYPSGAPATVPVVLVFGERGTKRLARGVDRLLRDTRSGIGLALRDFMTVDGTAVERTSLGRRAGPDFLLHHRRLELLVTADSPRRIRTRGLRLDRLAVTAILDPLPDGDAQSYRAALEVCLQATGAAIVSAANPYAPLVIGALGEDRVTIVTAKESRSQQESHDAVIRAVAQRLGGVGESSPTKENTLAGAGSPVEKEA